MNNTRLLVLTTCLIVYGSLYPFNFSQAEPEALIHLFSNRNLITPMGDMVGNVILFLPLGMIVMLNRVRAWGLFRASIGAIVIGLTLALGLQVLQIFLPTRDAALADVAWNMLGMLMGTLAGGYIACSYKLGLAIWPLSRAMPLYLLAGLIAIEWLPLVPSLDLQLIKAHLKALGSTPVTLAAPLWHGAGVAIFAGYLLGKVFNPRQSPVGLLLLLWVIALGKLLMEDMLVQPSEPVGLALGCLVWASVQQFTEVRRSTLVWITLILCYTASALAPYQLRDEAASISWLPFATMLDGPILSNLRSLTSNLVFYVGILYVNSRVAGRLAPATLALALWVLMTELIQTMIKGRSADITEPLLVLLVSQILAVSQTNEVERYNASNSSARPHKTRHPAGLTTWLLQAGVASSVLVFSLTGLLSLPGIPYNLRELFRADASLLALFAFSVTLLWSGGGAAWLGSQLARARWPGLQLLPYTLLVSGVSFAWLWAGVTAESIEDISGSANRFWFVTQRDVWGEMWRDVFLWIDSPRWIGAVEHFVRYSALYAPLPVVLGVLIAARQTTWRNGERALRLAGLLLGASALLWLCKAIAFDWTSTDNLNELIARDGRWGWGGGGFLYALLVVICLNSLLLVEAVSIGPHQIGLVALISLAALPVGWWLLNEGLEPNIYKYGILYSGTQFMLGQDRLHALDSTSLLLRWCAAQLSSVLILASGVWLGQSACRKTLLTTLPRQHASLIHKKVTE